MDDYFNRFHTSNLDKPWCFEFPLPSSQFCLLPGSGVVTGEGLEPLFVANVTSYLVTFIRILQNLYYLIASSSYLETFAGSHLETNFIVLKISKLNF